MIFYIIKCPVCNETFRNKDFVLLNELNTILHLKCQDDYPFPLGVKEIGTFKTVQSYYGQNISIKENQ